MAMSQQKKIKLTVADVWLDDEDIIRMEFHPTKAHRQKDAEEVTAAHVELSNNEKRPVLADLRNVTVGADKDARNYYATEESSRLKTAMAILTNSRAQRTFGSIYIYLTRPPYPTRLFKSESEALAWLASFNQND